MKLLFLFTFCFSLTFNAFSQIGVDVNNQMETTVDYKYKRFRLGASFDPNKDKSNMIMPALKFEFIQKTDYNMYFGATLIDLDVLSSIRVPVGINFFPFETKHFGFLMEVYGSYGKEYEWSQPTGYDDRFFIRGVVGFTYRL